MSEPESSVTVFAGTASEAEMVRSYLEPYGIAVRLDDEHLGITAPYLAAPGGAAP